VENSESIREQGGQRFSMGARPPWAPRQYRAATGYQANANVGEPLRMEEMRLIGGRKSRNKEENQWTICDGWSS